MADQNERKWYERLWRGVRDWASKYIGGLFMETNSEDGQRRISLGRVLLMITMFHMIWTWRQGDELPPGLLEVFFALAGYVFGTKLTGAISSRRPLHPINRND